MEDSGVHVGGDAYGGVRVTAPRTRRTRTSLRSLMITGTLSGLVLVGSGFAWAIPGYLSAQITSVDAGTAGSSSRSAMNILLVGVDKRDDLTRKEQNQLHLGRQEGQRTDTMMVIHLSEDHRKVTVVSLPRDTWLDIPGKGEHKINSAYQFGGPKLAVQTVQQATGLRINHYIAVNVLGFIDVVEALGGITVCTPVPIDDDKTKLKLAAGTHQLNGVNALHYARTRATGRADLDRIDRQQQVISALLAKAISGDTLTNPAKFGALVNSTLRTLTVDAALSDDFLGLATQLKDVSTDNVSFVTVPLADVNYRTATGESAVLWDKAAARDLFHRINTDQPLIPPVKPSKSPTATPSPTAATIAPNRIAIRVRNGTLITGLGARTKSALLAAGFLVPTVPGDTATRTYKNTIIRYGPARGDSVRTVAAAFPGAELRQVDIDGIEVILGAENHTVRKPVTATPKPTPTAASTPTTKTATQNICK
ncbi:LCP family protein [Acrocarpospora macrocephala]|uniref:LytR family transcriptional regulator n=1 Tax=Acrocarpospora macrocephala TaxID=150177 RepID=A0A5M3XES5_9ACTN|nr:LytR family transcriptional regulator [Acrocarpospora macrocephala]